MIDYAGYKLEDYLTDESFKAWVKGVAAETVTQHWKQVMTDHPGQRALMERAAMVIREFSQPSTFTLDSSRQISWEQVQSRISGVKPVKQLVIARAVAVAAIVIVLAGAAWWWQHATMQLQQRITVAAERQRLVLPDASVVILGANSSLSYKPNWQNNQVREVWLQGEASFEVKHLNKDTARVTDHQRFLVHVNNEVTVEVLGTVFLVRNRRGKTTVSLESGSVKVDVAGKKARQLLLKPGETVEVNAQQESGLALLPRKENITPLWRSGNLLLNNTAVLEIVQALEDNYGKKVTVLSPELLDKRVDGVLPLNNEKQALMALSSILDADIHEEKGGTIVLRKN